MGTQEKKPLLSWGCWEGVHREGHLKWALKDEWEFIRWKERERKPHWGKGCATALRHDWAWRGQGAGVKRWDTALATERAGEVRRKKPQCTRRPSTLPQETLHPPGCLWDSPRGPEVTSAPHGVQALLPHTHTGTVASVSPLLRAEWTFSVASSRAQHSGNTWRRFGKEDPTMVFEHRLDTHTVSRLEVHWVRTRSDLCTAQSPGKTWQIEGPP